LAEEKRLDLDAKIARWFAMEDWFARLPNGKYLTLRMLMNHTSGIPEHVLDPKFIAVLREKPDKVWKPEELIAYVLDKNPLFPAGQGWSYADTNYILVGMIIERETKQTCYELIRRRLLEPLKLKQTVPSDRRALPGLITGYSQPNSPFGFEGRFLRDGKGVINPQCEWAGGGFVSTAGDLARWAKALYEGKAFGEEMRKQMLAGVPAKTGRGDKYGLGVQIRQTAPGLSYGHGGWFPGYLSEMEYFPEKRVAIAVQFNTDDMRSLRKSPHAIIVEIARTLFSE
jgi:D-alanyl-D-alanine carboxypeptidase